MAFSSAARGIQFGSDFQGSILKIPAIIFTLLFNSIFNF